MAATTEEPPWFTFFTLSNSIPTASASEPVYFSASNLVTASASESAEGQYGGAPSVSYLTGSASFASTTFSAVASSTSSSGYGAGDTASSALSVQTTVPATYPDHGNDHSEHRHAHLSPGALAAAIIVPVILALFLLGLAFFLLRRRRRQRVQQQTQYNNDDRDLPPMTSSSRPPPLLPPLILNTSNNAYGTGLDTSESGSYSPPPRISDVIDAPPPPYFYAGAGGEKSAQRYSIPRKPIPAPQRTRSPFEDPPSPSQEDTQEHYGIGAGLLVPPTLSRPELSRNPSGVSISSTTYSASIHSAHEARMSIGGAAQVVRTQRGSGGDPFGSPVGSVGSRGSGERGERSMECE